MRITEDIFMVGSGQIRLSNRADCHVYLVTGGKELALIDSGVGLETESIFNNIRQEGFNEKDVSCLFLTHCHADHAGGCKEIRMRTGCKIITSSFEGRLLETGTDEQLALERAKKSGVYPQDYSFPHCKVDRIVNDGDKIKVGRYDIQVIKVPGHSKGAICLLLDRDGYRVLFSSDVVFVGGTIGLGNWSGSSLDDYRESIEKLGNLSIDALLPGHYLWTLNDGQEHLDKAIENLKSVWVPPAWQHRHFHF